MNFTRASEFTPGRFFNDIKVVTASAAQHVLQGTNCPESCSSQRSEHVSVSVSPHVSTVQGLEDLSRRTFRFTEVKLESRYDRPLKERLPRSSLDCEVRTAGHSRLRLSGSPSPTLGQVCNQVGNFGFSVSSSQMSGWHLDLISHSYARQKVTSFETPAAAAFANITICSAFVIDQDSRTSAV